MVRLLLKVTGVGLMCMGLVGAVSSLARRRASRQFIQNVENVENVEKKQLPARKPRILCWFCHGLATLPPDCYDHGTYTLMCPHCNTSNVVKNYAPLGPDEAFLGQMMPADDLANNRLAGYFKQ